MRRPLLLVATVGLTVAVGACANAAPTPTTAPAPPPTLAAKPSAAPAASPTSAPTAPAAPSSAPSPTAAQVSAVPNVPNTPTATQPAAPATKPVPAPGTAAPAVVQVTLTNAGCAPAASSVQAGPVTFQIRNNGGDKVTEVELVKGDLIVGEKENLAPGLAGSFSVNLPAGDYELYCPGADTEKSPLKVTAQPGAPAAAAVPPEVRAAFDQAAIAYRAYVRQEVDQLVVQTRALAAAVAAGDTARAKQIYPLARVHYERIEPVAESFGDLDPAIDMREDDAKNPADFTGFHRIEKALWQDGKLDGMAPIAQKLVDDVTSLQKLVADPNTFKVDAAQVANGSTELLDEVARSKVTGEEERYSKLDLLDMAANVEGARKGFELLQPGLKLIDAGLSDTIGARFGALDAAVAPYKRGEAWLPYDQLKPADVKALSQAVNDLAEPLSQVAAKVVVASGGALGDDG